MMTRSSSRESEWMAILPHQSGGYSNRHQSHQARRAVPLLVALVLVILSPLMAAGASNPVPQINQPLVPSSAAPGGPAFMLTVNGTGFVSTSAVNWNGSARLTSIVSGSQLTATINAADIAVAGTASVTVVNPAPGGGASNVVFFTITNPTPSVTFANASGSPVATGNGSSFVAVGDFNGDGKLDLAVANNSGGNLTILLGNGDGTFTPTAQSPATGTNPYSVAVGDFNGDGKLDLAVTNLNVDTVTILLGNGDGTFTPTAQSPATGSGPFGLAVGDFNGDGKLDLAVANSGSNNVTILLGNGDGTFTPTAQSPATGSNGHRLAVGDFNGDGKLDLAVVNTASNNVTILLGDGDGTFTPTAKSPAAVSGPTGLAVGDFNGDGKLDLVVTTDLTNNMTILLGNRDGTFTPSAQSANTGVAAASVAVGDFNGDGKLDLAVVNECVTIGECSSPGTVTILLGNGDGTFTAAAQSPAVGISPISVAVGDFNDDGRLDLAVTNGALTGVTDSVSILLQAPLVMTSPSSLTFTNQNIGTTGPAQTVTLTNTGSLDLTISGIVASGDFASTTTCPASPSALAVNANCTINVTFAPTGSGTRAGTLTIIDNAGNSPQTVALTGTGTGPVVGFAPASLGFTNQLLGTTSSPQSVTVNNTGNMALSISSIVASGDFAQTNTCSAPVAAGANCSITLTFTPTATGTRTGTLTLTDNASNSPQTVSLSGTGIAPAVTPSPATLSFASQYVGTSGLPQNVTILNTGTAPLTITNVQASSSFGETSGCTSSLAVGVSCTIGVFFDPTASGNITGTLTITDNAPGSPHTVSLAGTGQDFILAPASSSSTTATVARGQSATYTLTLAPGGGFNQPVTFTCTGAPAESTCNVIPGVVTLNPTTATNVTITVTTTAASMVTPLFKTPPGAPGLLVTMPRQPRSLLLLIWMLVFALLAGIALSCSTRIRLHGLSPIRFGFGVALLFVVILSAISMPACGGGGSGGGGGGNPGTPAGTYNLNVTGTFASGTTTLTHNVKLILTVN